VEGGEAVCDCLPGRAGHRCQDSICPAHFCLAGGTCLTLEGEPECLCRPGWTGDRCQLETNKTVLSPLGSGPGALAVPVLVWVLAALTATLATTVLALSCWVARLRRRPRVVRKRFISVPQSQQARPAADGSGVSLDIENCCDMTLCETPCFEPPVRGARAGRSCKSDKQSLLAACEEDY